MSWAESIVDQSMQDYIPDVVAHSFLMILPYLFGSQSLQQSSTNLIWEPEQYLSLISVNQNSYRSVYTSLAISLCIAQKDGSYSDPNAHGSPVSVSRACGTSEDKSRVYVLLQVLSLATALAFLQSCTRTAPISTADSKELLCCLPEECLTVLELERGSCLSCCCFCCQRNISTQDWLLPSWCHSSQQPCVQGLFICFMQT